ncbi:MAG: cytochrome P450 [Myxococcota bacterium]|nr:cytochrome P450 [Myxococcota bacterium]
MQSNEICYSIADFWTWDGAMWEQLRWLRTNDPVHWSELDQLFVLTRFEDTAYVSKHNDLFCSGDGVLPVNGIKLGLIDEDEPRHTELRRLINKGFTPRMVKKLEGVFETIVKQAIDAVAARGECDFVTDIAVPVPLLLIAEMLGIRREDFERFHQWSNSMILAQGRLHVPEVAARAGQAFAEYADYVTGIIEARRAEPEDDLISILVHAKDEGVLVDFDHGPSDLDYGYQRSEEDVSLNNDELIKFCVLLLVAGNETTRNGLSGAIQLLIEHPDQRQQLIDDPGKIPAAVEELLRLTSPVVSFVRTATQDTELRGQKIAQGQKVLMIYPSANRDPEEFEDPDELDIGRNPHHLAFGVGNHFCLGANLARMELRVALRELLRRLPDLEYSDGGPKMAPAALVRSYQHIRVRFTPEG